MTETTTRTVALDVAGLNVDYRTADGALPVLRDITFTLRQGEILGIVGESGCGKSTLGAALMRQLPANGTISSGSVHADGVDLVRLSEPEMRTRRGRQLAMIFQDPLTSLNPVFTVGYQMRRVFFAHHQGGRGRRVEATERATEALLDAGLDEPQRMLRQFPHQLSGGQRQRVIIAMAMMLGAPILVADEPTSALDVTRQAQIVELLMRVRREHGTSILFISHDLPLVGRLCDRVMVMYAGRVVESGPSREILGDPQHPYTRALIGASPSRHQRDRPLTMIPGRVPDLLDLPSGCAFQDRCPEVIDQCRTERPAPVGIGPERTTSCHVAAGRTHEAGDRDG